MLRDTPFPGWRSFLIEVLAELAGCEAEWEKWIKSGEAELVDPVELACQLFDDSGLGDMLEAGPVFGESIDGRFRRLGEALDAVDSERGPEGLLGSPEWREVARLARELGAALSE